MSLAGAIQAAKDKKFGESSFPSAKRVMRLAEILDRPHADTRELNVEHVQELADSIAAVGLIQPLAVDKSGHLLAGGHRRAALHLLKQQDPECFAKHFAGDQIPVRVFEFRAKDEPGRAIEIEAAENEKRRDYTREEVLALAERLKAAGYRDKPGKPKAGEKSLRPAIGLIIGKSARTVRRYLNEEPEPKEQPDEQTRTDGLVSKWLKALDQIEAQAPDLLGDEEVGTMARELWERIRDLSKRN
jgi:ParB family transcriptional regulator, chromosome partitioning protein